jgi:hypothetical protein
MTVTGPGSALDSASVALPSSPVHVVVGDVQGWRPPCTANLTGTLGTGRLAASYAVALSVSA